MLHLIPGKIFLAVLIVMSLQIHAQTVQPGSYQVQNKATGLVLRPLDANGANGTPIVVYPPTSWKCMTWDFKPAKDAGAFLLWNYFTSKTFTTTTSAQNAPLVETPMDTAKLKGFRFVPAGNGFYRIEDASGLVLTVDGDDVNARVVLKKWNGDAKQLWKLLPKPERFTA